MEFIVYLHVSHRLPGTCYEAQELKETLRMTYIHVGVSMPKLVYCIINRSAKFNARSHAGSLLQLPFHD